MHLVSAEMVSGPRKQGSNLQNTFDRIEDPLSDFGIDFFEHPATPSPPETPARLSYEPSI